MVGHLGTANTIQRIGDRLHWLRPVPHANRLPLVVSGLARSFHYYKHILVILDYAT